MSSSFFFFHSSRNRKPALTYYDVCFRTFLLQQIRGVIVALHDSYFGELRGDLLSLLVGADKSCVFVIGIFVVKFVERVTANVTGGSRTEEMSIQSYTVVTYV